MGNILQNLYSGKIVPWERRNHHSEEQHDIVRQIDEEENLLFGQISPEGKERYQKLSALRSSLFESEEVDLFAYSFTLGATLMLELLGEAEARNFV